MIINQSDVNLASYSLDEKHAQVYGASCNTSEIRELCSWAAELECLSSAS